MTVGSAGSRLPREGAGPWGGEAHGPYILKGEAAECL